MSTNVSLAATLPTASALTTSRLTANKQFSAQANEFEAMLLTQWLQSSESTFGSAPGEDDSGSAGDDQIKSFALQQLASGIAAKGGFGIARYVSAALTETQLNTSSTSKGSGSALHEQVKRGR